MGNICSSVSSAALGPGPPEGAAARRTDECRLLYRLKTFFWCGASESIVFFAVNRFETVPGGVI